MRLLKITLATIGSIVLIILLAVGLLFLVDLGRFKGTIVEFASDYLERDVAIDGTLSIELGRQVRVAAEGVRVASTEWTEEPELVSLREVSVVVDAWSALSGIVLVEEVRAGGIRTNLAVDAQGKDNWTFAALETDDSEDSEIIPVVLRQAQISDVEITYVDPDWPPLRFASSSIDLQERDDGDIGFQVAGALNDTALTATGRVGPIDNIIDGADVRFTLSGEIGEIALEGSGQIDDLVEPRKPQIEFAVRGPNAEYFTQVLGIDPVTTGPLELAGKVEEADGRLNVLIDGTFGEFDVRLTGALADLQSTDDLNVVLRASGPSVATVAKLAGREDFPALPFSVDAALARAGESVTIERLLVDFGAAELDANASVPRFPSLEGARVNLTARGPKFGHFNRLLGLPGRLTGPFEINADLVQQEDGGSTLAAELAAKDIQARVSGDLTAHPELVGSEVEVEATGADLSILTAALGTEGIPAQAFGVRAELAMIEEAIEIKGGEASLGKERLDFEGVVGMDPFSQRTLLRFTTRIEDLSEVLTNFEIEVEGVADGALELNGEIGRGDGAFVIKNLIAKLEDIEAQLNGQVGDSFALDDIELALDLKGTSLAAIAPIDEIVSDSPFRVVTQIGFSSDDKLQLTGLEASLGQASARLELSASLSLDSGNLTIDAAGPSLGALVPAAAEYMPEADAFSVRGGGRWQQDDLWIEPTAILVGEAAVDIQGKLHAPPNLAGSAMTLSARIPSLKNLRFLTDQPLPDEPFSAQAIVSGTPTDLELRDLQLALGPSRVTGAASFRLPEEPDDIPAFTAEIRSDSLDLRHFQSTSQDPEPAPSEPTGGQSRLIPDTPIPVAALRQINGSFDLAAREIVLQNANLRDVALTGNLSDGALRVDRFALTDDRGGALSGNASISPTAAGIDVALNVDGSNLVIGLPADTEEDRQLLPTYEIRTEMVASGATIRELASTSTGYLRLVGGEGRLAISAVGFLTRDFAGEVLDAVNPLAKSETHSKVQCTAVLIEATDGVVVGQPAVVFQSSKLNITGVGKVDLKTEKLNAKFSTQARKGLGIGVSDLVSPLTQVGGTLASPSLQLNAKGALIEGGLAVATGGLSFLAKKARDRLFSNPNPCQKAIQEADADLESRKPES